MVMEVLYDKRSLSEVAEDSSSFGCEASAIGRGSRDIIHAGIRLGMTDLCYSTISHRLLPVLTRQSSNV